MNDVSIKDNDNVIHQINVDTLKDNTDTQVIKIQLGNAGEDGGLGHGFILLFSISRELRNTSECRKSR